MSLPFDHDEAEAFAALSVPNESTPGGVSRRRFLAGLGAAGVIGTVAGSGVLRPRSAHAQATDRNLVVLLLQGGNDGFATVTPTQANPLDQLRPSLLVPRSSLLGLGDGYGLHPSLSKLHAEWQAGRLALVGGVGTAGQHLSHFAAMHEWMAGVTPSQAGSATGTGWLGRWLDTLGPAEDTPLRAVSFTGQVPLMLVGHTTAGVGLGAAGVTMLGSTRKTIAEHGLYNSIDARAVGVDTATSHGYLADLASASTTLAKDLGRVYAPAPPPDGPVAQATLAARLLNDASFGCRTALCSIGGFDHHTDLVKGQAAVLGAVDRVISTLFATLQPAVADRTAVLVVSEFGRRPAANGSAGTDHGTAGYSFLAGPPVKGGLQGTHLDPSVRDSWGNIPVTVPHLDLIGSVLAWLGADPDAIIGASTSRLDLFR